MVEMVSNIRLLNEIGATSTNFNEGARCSKTVLDMMCTQMASPSNASIYNNNVEIPAETSSIIPNSCQFEYKKSNSCENEPRLAHPAVSLIGPLFSPDDFDVLDLLGEGFFSKVYKVRNRTTGEVLVLKEGKPTGTCRSAQHADAAREATIMRSMDHENVLHFRGMCISVNVEGQWDANVLVAYCGGGSLARMILDTQKQFTWHRRVRYARDIANAMRYIHSKRIIHRDLTSMNVLIDCEPKATSSKDAGLWGRAVVADFGLSCPFPERGEQLTQVGTTYFMSPECLKEEFYDEKSDVFSFGIILCQMIARIDADPDGGLQRTSNFGLDYMLFTPLCPLDTPIEMLKLAFNCCLMDPTARPCFEMAYQTLCEILVSLPPPQSRSPEMSRDGKEPRLGRSRSDAALKRPKGLTTRKLSTNYLKTVKPVIEGEIDQSTAFLMEELARTVSRDEPTHDHTNPFQDHERFRKERKIFPKKLSSKSRRRSETKRSEDNVPSSPTSAAPRTPRRRCMSLPCDIESPLVEDAPDKERTFIVHHTRGEASFDAADCSSASQMSTSFACPGASPASGIPMQYRDFDRNFLKQMKRYPSRRHTMMTECLVPSSISTCDLAYRDAALASLAVGSCAVDSASEQEKTPVPRNKRRLFGGREREKNSSETGGKTPKSELKPEVLEPTTCETNQVDTVVIVPPIQKRRLQRICSASHRTATDCSIL